MWELFKHNLAVSMSKRVLFFLLITIELYPAAVFGQQSRLSQNVNYITEFIASDYFKNLSKTNSDLALVDTIYLRAVHKTDGNYDEAFLALTFAAVPYRKVPIQIPIIKTIVYYPLVSDADSIFLQKNKNLPKNLYFDTPQNSFGDKDKLAHFFGSAYISYSSHIFDLGNLIGYFVEVFEENFKVQSKIDNRDLQTNKLGNIFGDMLKKYKHLLPSRVLIFRTLQYLSFNL